MEWEFSGKNVEAAIRSGLEKLRLSKEDVEIKILDEGKAGLFGLMGAVPARIKIISSKKPDTVDWDKASRKALELTMAIAGKIEDNAKADVRIAGRKIRVTLDGGNKSPLIGNQGTTLHALNYVVNLMMKKDPETRADVMIDAGGYGLLEISEAEKKLEKAARKVRSSGKPVELDPMEAPQRKAVHRKAQELGDIETESVGRDEKRRVLVKKKS